MGVPASIPGCIACLTSEVELLKVIAAEAGEDLGENGAQIINDVAAHTGTWKVITAMQDCNFTSLISTNIGLNDLAPGELIGGVTPPVILKGITLYGTFTKIQLSASNPPGVLIAYK